MNGKTKRELMKDTSISSQQAIVSALLPTGITPIKRLIPGGKTMLETLDKETMPKAIHTWLKGCGTFSEVKISFAKNPEEFSPTIIKIENFPSLNGKPFWEKQDGRKELATLLATILSNHKKVLFITAKSDGIYIGQDSSGKFSPKVTVTKELIESNRDYASYVEGDRAPSSDWEPYIEFLPSNKSKYSVFRKN